MWLHIIFYIIIDTSLLYGYIDNSWDIIGVLNLGLHVGQHVGQGTVAAGGPPVLQKSVKNRGSGEQTTAVLELPHLLRVASRFDAQPGIQFLFQAQKRCFPIPNCKKWLVWVI